MRILVHLLTMLLLFIAIPGCGGGKSEREVPDQGWTDLFDGSSLDGWVVYCLPGDSAKQYWRALDWYIECNSMGDPDHDYVWLATEKEFGDFHLKLEFQVFRSSPGNSGVQFRSRYDDSDTARNGGWLNGPQADIHGPLPMRTGLIYDETEGVHRWIYPSLPDWSISEEQVPEAALKTDLVYWEEDPDAWNTLEIICRDMHVETLVNGHRVTVLDAEGILNDRLHRIRHSGEKGCIALQLHMRDQLQIRFRNIKIIEL